MALIKCPECGNNISDKAEECIHCGFPLSEYVDEQAVKEEEEVEIKQEFPQLPVLVANFDKDYVIAYDNGIIKIIQDDNILYDGDVRNIEIHGLKKSILDFGRLELFVLKSRIPSDLYCKDDESFAICQQIVDDYELRTKEKREKTKQRIQERERMKQCCPKCGSVNYHAFVEDKVIRQGKTKIQTSVNLNPLKPFTLFNTKEKVVREPWTMQVSKFVCDDCGKIFQ